jgi:hypothetical protein
MRRTSCCPLFPALNVDLAFRGLGNATVMDRTRGCEDVKMTPPNMALELTAWGPAGSARAK